MFPVDLDIHIFPCLPCQKRTQDPVEDLGREAFEFTMDDTLGHQEGLGWIDLEQQVDEVLPKIKKYAIGLVVQKIKQLFLIVVL